MREGFADELAAIERDLMASLDHAANILTTVAGSLEDPTHDRAAVIAMNGRALADAARSVHARLTVITARQSPVATDLRRVMAMLELSHHAALIANQFALISEQMAAIDPAIGDRLNADRALSRMCALASGQLRKAAAAFATRDLALAYELDRDDDAVDRLNRDVFEAAARTETAHPQRELGFRRVLLARCLERIADNAVDVAEQAAFVITANRQEFSDASQPRARN
jgi:phosphate transport system protein